LARLYAAAAAAAAAAMCHDMNLQEVKDGAVERVAHSIMLFSVLGFNMGMYGNVMLPLTSQFSMQLFNLTPPPQPQPTTNLFSQSTCNT
jgi:hypothetical protein